MPKPCPICGSTKWRRDNISGSAICEDGHVFQDFRSENLVVENSAHALQKRSLKKGPRRNRRRDRGDVNRDHYRGNDAEYLKVQALQLLLRWQVQALKRIWDLPDVYENIVRDLWAYQLASVNLPPPPDPDRPPEVQEGGPLEDDIRAGPASEEDEHNSVHSESSHSGESELSTPDDALEEELIARLSADTSEDKDLHDVGESSQAHDVGWRRRRRIQITDTLVTVVVALWVLRIPLLNVDLENLVTQNRIPYLDFGHTTLIPMEMKKHMDRKLVQALSPRGAPRPEYLHEQCTTFVRIVARQFKLVIPEANLAPISWRVIWTAGGTPTTYAQVMRLLALLDINTTLTSTHVDSFTRKLSRRRSTKSPSRPRTEPAEKTIERTTRYEDVWLPEVSVAAALVMVMKMAYGLDGTDRPALTWSDPVIGLPQSEPWIQELAGLLEVDSLNQTRSSIKQQDFASMDLDDIDNFLFKCERVLLKDHDVGNDLTFPLHDEQNFEEPHILGHKSTFSHWTKGNLVQPSTKPLNMPNKDLPPLPGERLRVYEPTDLTGTLPKEYDILLKSCAAVIGVEESHLARCVEVYETRLEKMRLDRASRSRSVSRTNSGAGRGRRPKSMGSLRDQASSGVLTPPATS